MNLSNKQILIIVSVVVVILALILWYTYSAGKKSQASSSAKAPSDVIGTPLTEEREQFLDGLAQSLHYDMQGINMTWDNSLYDQASMLGNNELVALSNIFNYQYQAESGETFLQWLQGENFSWDDFGLASSVQILKDRLVELGVS